MGPALTGPYVLPYGATQMAYAVIVGVALPPFPATVVMPAAVHVPFAPVALG